jgi:hypothetical protein
MYQCFTLYYYLAMIRMSYCKSLARMVLIFIRYKMTIQDLTAGLFTVRKAPS